MFFVLFPTGLKRPLRQRPLVAIIIIFAILYRAILAGIEAAMQLDLVSYFPVQRWDIEILSAVLQSYFTPNFPPDAVLEHTIILIISTIAIVFFWIIFGSALEDDLGRTGLLAFYTAAGIAGLTLLITPAGAISGAFWLGHAATVTALGASYVLHTREDFRISYLFWWILGGASYGHFTFPTIFALIPLHLLIIAGQSIYWYDREAPVIPLRDGPLLPLAWNILLTLLGAAFAIALTEWRRSRAQARGENTTQWQQA